MMNTLEYINKNSDYVTIDKDKIRIFVDNVSKWQYNYWINDVKPFLDEKKRIIFAFVCETINFCFWGNANNDDCNNKQYAGSQELFHNIKEAVRTNPSTIGIDNLVKLTEDDFKKMIGEEFEQIPLFTERYNMLKDTISIIYNKGDNFYSELFSLNSDIELLNYIVQNFWHFDDKSEYKGVTIKFNKRATLLVNDLFQLSETIKNNIKSLDNLTGCADYAVPRLLCEYGILKYDERLLKIINSNTIIEHNSNIEVEIRANTLYVIELIKEALRKKGLHLNSIEIDSIVWGMRRSISHSIPVHKTITIYY